MVEKSVLLLTKMDGGYQRNLILDSSTVRFLLHRVPE